MAKTPTKPTVRRDTTGKTLTKAEIIFRDEYLLTLNAYKSARKAGYAHSTANGRAPQWVGKTREQCPANKRHLWDAVHEALAARSERTQIDADYVLKRHAEIDQMDVQDILDDRGEFKPLCEWPKVWTTTLSGLEVTEMLADGASVGLLKKIKWPDKLKNLELLGKHVDIGAYRENVSVTSDDELTKRILAGRQRVKS